MAAWESVRVLGDSVGLVDDLVSLHELLTCRPRRTGRQREHEQHIWTGHSRTGWHELTWSRSKWMSRIRSGHIRHFSTAGLSERTWRPTLTAVDAATEHDYGGRGAPPGARLHRRLAMSHLPRARRPFTFHHPKRDRRWRRHDRSWERREM